MCRDMKTDGEGWPRQAPVVLGDAASAEGFTLTPAALQDYVCAIWSFGDWDWRRVARDMDMLTDLLLATEADSARSASALVDDVLWLSDVARLRHRQQAGVDAVRAAAAARRAS